MFFSILKLPDLIRVRAHEPFQGPAILEEYPLQVNSDLTGNFIKNKYKINSLKGLMNVNANGRALFSCGYP